MRQSGISIENISFSYPHLYPTSPPPPLFRALTLHVSNGMSVGVMGASGSGKSTLCHIVAGLAPRYTGGTLEGFVQVAGHSVNVESPPVGSIGIVLQDAPTQLFSTTVEHEIAWGLEALGIQPSEITRRVNEILSQFGLMNVRNRPPWALSGGQQKRLALAAIWAQRPKVMILDEPLGGLDPEGRADLLNAFETLSQSGTTLLLTTLNPQAAKLTSNISLLIDGKLAPLMDTEKALAQEEALVNAGILYPTGYWPKFQSGTQDNTLLAVEIQDLQFSYARGTSVFEGLNLSLPQGQFIALVGRNGAGKTTLLRHLNGLLRPTRGSIHIMGQDIKKSSVGELAQSVGLLFQRPEQQLFGTTVHEEIAYGPKHLKLPDAERRVSQAIARFELTAYADQPPATLSYGLQRTVTLAILAALETPILALDEPTVGLDGRGWAQFLSWLAERQATGATIIIATHELELAAAADRVIALSNGKILEDGPPATILPHLSWEMAA